MSQSHRNPSRPLASSFLPVDHLNQSVDLAPPVFKSELDYSVQMLEQWIHFRTRSQLQGLKALKGMVMEGCFAGYLKHDLQSESPMLTPQYLLLGDMTRMGIEPLRRVERPVILWQSLWAAEYQQPMTAARLIGQFVRMDQRFIEVIDSLLPGLQKHYSGIGFRFFTNYRGLLLDRTESMLSKVKVLDEKRVLDVEMGQKAADRIWDEYLVELHAKIDAHTSSRFPGIYHRKNA